MRDEYKYPPSQTASQRTHLAAALSPEEFESTTVEDVMTIPFSVYMTLRQVFIAEKTSPQPCTSVHFTKGSVLSAALDLFLMDRKLFILLHVAVFRDGLGADIGRKISSGKLPAVLLHLPRPHLLSLCPKPCVPPISECATSPYSCISPS